MSDGEAGMRVRRACCLLLRVAQRLWDRALRVVAFAWRQFSFFL